MSDLGVVPRAERTASCDNTTGQPDKRDNRHRLVASLDAYSQRLSWALAVKVVSVAEMVFCFDKPLVTSERW